MPDKNLQNLIQSFRQEGRIKMKNFGQGKKGGLFRVRKVI